MQNQKHHRKEKMSEEMPPSFTSNPQYTQDQIESADGIIDKEIQSGIWDQTLMEDEITQTLTANVKGSGVAIHPNRSSEHVMGILEVLSKSCINASGLKIVIPAFSIAVDYDEKVGMFYTIELVGDSQRSNSNPKHDIERL
jgi:hypothetical protein